MTENAQIEIIRKIDANRRLAHAWLFAHRHPDTTPAFHNEIIDLWHSPAPKVVILAMRGGAKSTLSEECVAIGALYREFKYALIIGNNEARAVDRLTAIKHELEFNEKIQAVFGDPQGPTWQEKKIVLKNGTAIEAYGRGQSLRGAKHLDARPDIVFVDDLEDDESVLTPEQRQKTLNWFVSVLIPALDPNARLRVMGTPLDPEALLPILAKDPSWATRIYPARYIDPQTNEPRALWPERFSLEWIENKEQEFARLGVSNKFAQEYMCQASDPDTKAFTQDLFKTDQSLQRTWQPVYAFYDPARTTKKSSDFTGVVVFSWIGSKLVVWDAYGKKIKPDEIINDIFEVDAKYAPVEIGVEKDGLEDFLMQPIRQQQVARSQTVPVQAYAAPKGKIDFIKGLQPFFKAGEVVFAKPLPDLEQQLLGFPTGKIDIPNALAYALKMRPGVPVFNNFRLEHVREDARANPRTQIRIAMAATQQYTAGVLFQFVDGRLLVLDDAMAEGPPGDNAQNVVRALSMSAGRTAQVYAAASAYGAYDQIGLLPTLKRIPVAVVKGGPSQAGREELRAMLNKYVNGTPSVQVSSNATWVLRALSGGYAREIDRLGQVSDFPKKNMYATVMEALESVIGLAAAVLDDEQDNVRYSSTAAGQRFITARAT